MNIKKKQNIICWNLVVFWAGLFCSVCEVCADNPVFQSPSARTTENKRQQELSQQSQNDNNFSVFTRKHPEYEPLNIRFGNFILEPSLGSEVSYVDNVYAAPDKKIGDRVFALRVGLKTKYELRDHTIESESSIDDFHYADSTSENHKNARLYLGLNLNVSPDTQIPISMNYIKNHALRDDPNDRDGAVPTVYYTKTIQSGIRYSGAKLALAYNLGLTAISYGDNLNESGVTINNHDRNRKEVFHSVSLGYLEGGALTPYTYLEYRDINYDDEQDDFGVNHDSHGWAGGLGLKFKLSGVTSGAIKYGKMYRDFDDPSLAQISSGFYGVDMRWEPSSLLGFSLLGQRYIDEAALADTSVSVNTAVGLRITYELAPNLYLYPEFGYLLRDYQSSNNRSIKRFNQGINLSYKMNRNVWNVMSFENSEQQEKKNGAFPVKTESRRMMFGIRFQL